MEAIRNPGDEPQVEFVSWNMELQIAMDSLDRIWTVRGWHTRDPSQADTINGDLIQYQHGEPEFADQWDRVDFVTVYCDIDGKRQWSDLNPDDFNVPTH